MRPGAPITACRGSEEEQDEAQCLGGNRQQIRCENRTGIEQVENVGRIHMYSFLEEDEELRHDHSSPE